MAIGKNRRIAIKRVYDTPSAEDGFRILVDRIWPRGVSKSDAQIHKWTKDIAPTTELRKWFGHNPEKWLEFKKRYFRQIKEHSELVNDILHCSREQTITLVYAAKDQKYNNAVALKEYIEKQMK